MTQWIESLKGRRAQAPGTQVTGKFAKACEAARGEYGERPPECDKLQIYSRENCVLHRIN